MNVDYLMRSLMFVPAHNERLMDSATRVDADVLLLDIEDSVQPLANKQVARDNIVKYVSGGRFSGRPVFPRINDRESGQLLKDVTQLTIAGVTGFMYPKAKKGEDIYFFGKLLETIEFEIANSDNTDNHVWNCWHCQCGSRTGQSPRYCRHDKSDCPQGSG